MKMSLENPGLDDDILLNAIWDGHIQLYWNSLNWDNV